MSLLSWTIASPVAPAREDEEEGLDGDFPAHRSDTTIGDQEIDLKGDQFEDMTDAKLKLGTLDLWALGISTALGGQYYLWNSGLALGFGNFIVGIFLVGSAYGCLLVCMAELSGALPFAGGAYGIVRVTLGSLPGYLVAWFDCYQSMFYTMLSTLLIGLVITFVTDGDERWTPVWWLFIYLSYLIPHAIGGLFFWRTMKVLSIGSLLLLVMFILGSIKFANFEENAALDVKPGHPAIEAWFVGSPLKFFQILPAYCWMFLGIESLNLAAHDAVEPKKDVPRAYMLSYATIAVICVATVFVAVSVPPGINVLKAWPLPHSFGYMLMFDINYKMAFCLAIPAIYTSGYGFMYHYSSQVRAMGKSGLISTCLGYDIPYFNTPLPAMLFGAVIGLLVGLRYQFLPTLRHEDLFSIGLIGTVMTYLSQFVSFIAFRLYYPTIKREFVSPLGIAGAVYGMLVFALILISLLGLERSPGIIAFSIYIVVLLIYYFLVVQKRQVYSEEERTVLFKAYLMKSNRLRNNRVRIGQARARRQGHGSTNSDQSISGERRGGIEMHKYDGRLKGSSDDERSTTTTTQRLLSGAVALGTSAAAAVGLISDRTIMVQSLGSEKRSSREKSYLAQAHTSSTSTGPHTNSTGAATATADIEAGADAMEEGDEGNDTAAAHPSLGRGPLAGPAAAAMLAESMSRVVDRSSGKSPTQDTLGGCNRPALVEEKSEEESPSPEPSGGFQNV